MLVNYIDTARPDKVSSSVLNDFNAINELVTIIICIKERAKKTSLVSLISDYPKSENMSGKNANNALNDFNDFDKSHYLHLVNSYRACLVSLIALKSTLVSLITKETLLDAGTGNNDNNPTSQNFLEKTAINNNSKNRTLKSFLGALLALIYPLERLW